MAREWLDVPYAEKDQAKAVGARWDPREKRWYAPDVVTPELRRWAALPDLPGTFPGEDRGFGAGLFVDLVPSSCWFTNVRSCVPQRDWERIRRVVTGRAARRCEVCGEAGQRLDVHERWAYDDARRVQALRRLICLCEPCHEVTHIGLAGIRGRADAAVAHLRAVTGMSGAEADAHVEDAFAVWRRRSAHTWTLDLGMLTDVGVTVAPPPKPGERATIAEQTLF
ncbi:DUF5710 domain-containing protein [Phytomonospora endophytica]|uniref:DUF5710 domain-containing protein n=1 Tax=Phytomonospora endophytica TaxID=714109 RepID=A0A841FQ84_9ACTN|nr:DUF5710 domain-containing protein [Phytomonospora endophytica]MBB6034120.1 hypothetical protein [Phytomonospora endophytica]GIG66514.1 hypothetical protein Pen01_28090 [Phytomonospora endophytica]